MNAERAFRLAESPEQLGIEIGSFRSLGVHDIDAYFGIWAVRAEPFMQMVDRLGLDGFKAHVEMERQNAQPRSQQGESDFTVTSDGVALIEVNGTMMKRASSFSGNTSTIEVRRQLRAAARDPEIAGIVLKIDSPGGTVAGTDDLAQEVVRASRQKPLNAFIEDSGASAAFWIASQATKVFANPTAIVGSIGTFAVIQDSSAMAGQLGVKVHVVKAGEFKGVGVPGTEVTEGQLADIQEVVNTLNEHFLAGVAKGRGMSMSAVRSLADGRVHVGQAAVGLGLIDGVQSFEATVQGLVSPSSRTRGVRQMSREDSHTTNSLSPAVSDPVLLETTPGPATYAELKEHCVKADSDFICQQMDKKATLAEAQKAWMIEQQTRLEEARKKTAESNTGVPPLVEGSKGGSERSDYDGADPIGEWNTKVEKLTDKGVSHSKASAKVNRQNPGLRQAMVEAYNQNRGRQLAGVR